MVLTAIQAGRRLHAKLLNRVLKRRMADFDTVPVGRLLNRFSKDVSEVDTHVAGQLLDWFGLALTVRQFTSEIDINLMNFRFPRL